MRVACCVSIAHVDTCSMCTCDRMEQHYLEQEIARDESHQHAITQLEQTWAQRQQHTETSEAAHDTRIDTIKRVFEQEREAWKEEKKAMHEQHSEKMKVRRC